MVLLLSLQLRGHVAFLARDPSTRPYRVDAVHFALALHAAQLLDGPSDGVYVITRTCCAACGRLQPELLCCLSGGALACLGLNV